MSNPYCVELNRQLSGKRGMFVKRGVAYRETKTEINLGLIQRQQQQRTQTRQHGHDDNKINKTIPRWHRETTST